MKIILIGGLHDSKVMEVSDDRKPFPIIIPSISLMKVGYYAPENVDPLALNLVVHHVYNPTTYSFGQPHITHQIYCHRDMNQEQFYATVAMMMQNMFNQYLDRAIVDTELTQYVDKGIRRSGLI